MIQKTNEFFKTLKRSFGYFFDREVPFYYKLIPGFAILYLLFPLDFVSDFLPFLGQLDDLSVLAVAFAAFTRLASKKKP